MKQKITDADILFFTTTIGTRWIFYQQYMLEKFFPQSKKVLIDGNQRWDFARGLDCIWYDFARVALENRSDYKYFIHIDEDCFVTDAVGVFEMLEKMESEGADLIGPSDHFYGIRGGNSDVINSFFMAGKISSLEHVIKNFNFSLTYRDIKPSLTTDVGEDLIEIEPYYNFFWNYLNSGFKITFINHEFDRKHLCTSLLNKDNSSFALHMWFTRKWNSKDIFHGITMHERYKRVEHYLNDRFHSSFFHVLKSNKQLGRILEIQYSRIVNKNISRIKRRIKKAF